MAFRLQTFLLIVSALVLLSATAETQTGARAVQAVTMEVKPITKISVSGNPAALVVSDALAGTEVLSVRDENTRYSITTNIENMKIVASINQQMPPGTKLMVRLESRKGMSVGVVDISNALNPVDVIRSISKGSDANQRITYIFAADPSVGEIPQQTRTITLTLTD
ncbi:MAG TPA: hypothetical protein VNL36_02985 [Bacteroidota bacterium]|nr:hypothetical protein [Bacteroidota bacterium]